MAHKIQDELDQVERQVYILEKEENELRRVRNTKELTNGNALFCLLSHPCFHLIAIYCIPFGTYPVRKGVERSSVSCDLQSTAFIKVPHVSIRHSY